MKPKQTVLIFFTCLFFMLPWLRGEKLFLENAYFEMYADTDADADLAGKLSNAVVTVVNQNLTLPPVFKNKILVELSNNQTQAEANIVVQDNTKTVITINRMLDLDFSELCSVYAKAFLVNIEIISGLTQEEANGVILYNDVLSMSQKIERMLFPFITEKSFFYIRAENAEDNAYASDFAEAASNVGKRMLPLPSYFSQSIIIHATSDPQIQAYATIIHGKSIIIKCNRIREISIYALCETISDALLTRIAIFNGAQPESAQAQIPYWLKISIAKEIDVAVAPFILDQLVVDSFAVTSLSVDEIADWDKPDPDFTNYAFWFFRTMQSRMDEQTVKFFVRDLILGQKLTDLLPKYLQTTFATKRDLEIYKATAMRETINKARTSLPVFDIVESVQRVNDLSKFILSINGIDKQLTLVDLEQYADYPAVQSLAEQRINEAMAIRSRMNPICANPIQSLCLALECIARKKMKYFPNSARLFYADVDFATRVIAHIYKVAEENNYAH